MVVQAITAQQGAGELFDNSILQMLDRWLPDEKDEKRIYYGSDAFTDDVLAALDGVPIVFADDHPDPRLFARDPVRALALVNGRIAGSAHAGRIEQEGHPRLIAPLEIRDAEALKLWKEGRLSLSTALFADVNDAHKIAGGIGWNHVLVFEEREGSTPNDLGTMIVNKREVTAMAEPDTASPDAPDETKARDLLKLLQTGLGRLLGALEKGIGPADDESAQMNGPTGADAPPPAPPMNDPPQEPTMTDDIQDLNRQIEEGKTALKNREDELAAKDARITELEARVAELEPLANKATDLETELETFRTEQKEAEVTAFVNKIPPGRKATPEAEKEWRDKYSANPVAAMNELTDALLNKAGATVPEGTQHQALANKGEGEPPKKKGVGVWDPYKKEFV